MKTVNGKIMTTVNIRARNLLLVAIGAGMAHAVATLCAEAQFSGISSYAFESNPQEITPKMFNWRVTLSKADSHGGAYEIVQITRPKRANSKVLDATPTFSSTPR